MKFKDLKLGMVLMRTETDYNEWYYIVVNKKTKNRIYFDTFLFKKADKTIKFTENASQAANIWDDKEFMYKKYAEFTNMNLRQNLIMTIFNFNKVVRK
jgi:hypothetical protein